MRAWVVARLAPPATALELREASDPVPGQDQALIAVELAGINFADRLLTEGRYQERFDPPFVIGTEIVGRVVSAPPESGIAPGTRVCGFAGAPDGGYAELALGRTAALFPIPDELDAGVALQLPVAYMTAWVGLRRTGRIAAGETVVVTAAAGAVGLAAVRIAAAAGATPVGLVGAEAKREPVAAAGAELVRLYDDAALEQALDAGSGIEPGVLQRTRAEGSDGSVDLLFDSVGGEVWERCLRLLRPGGRAVTIGFSGGEIPTVKMNRLLLRNISVAGLYVGGLSPSLVRASFDELLAACRSGELRPDPVEEVGLDDLPAAIERVAARETTGKLGLRLAG